MSVKMNETVKKRNGYGGKGVEYQHVQQATKLCCSGRLLKACPRSLVASGSRSPTEGVPGQDVAEGAV
jgi:hypothetical protein